MRRFIAQLAARSDAWLQIGNVEIADEFHATVPAVVLSRALREFHPPGKHAGAQRGVTLVRGR